MKKVLTILLALLVVTGVVFAADDAKLTLSAEKGLVLVQGITDEIIEEGVSLPEATLAVTKTVELEEDWTSGEEGENWDGAIYYSILTNAKSAVTVGVGMTPLTLDVAEGTKYYIPYTLTIGDDVFSFSGTDKPGTTSIEPLLAASQNLNGLSDTWGQTTSMRYYSKEIVVSIDGDPVDAMEGNYTATVTFAVTSNN